MRLAIMQPYFLPYAGYFRLFAAADLFVIYDCVQFPRRSFVHRNKLTHVNGQREWLTLPLAKAPQDTRIDALHFSAHENWSETLKQFPALASPLLERAGISPAVRGLRGTPVELIEDLLRSCCEMLELNCNIVRSSTLKLPEGVRGQDRILAICRHFGAKTYINSPGGRALYDARAFEGHEIALRFLSDYSGDMGSIAQRLADAGEKGLATLRNEVVSQAEILP